MLRYANLQIIMLNVAVYFLLVLAVDCTVPSKRFIVEVDLPELLQRLDGLTSTVNDLNHPPVAFKAHLTSPISPGANQRIIFDDVQLNTGNAYHRHLGGFLAPLNGTYLFSVSVCSDNGHYIVLDLMKNAGLIGRVLAGDSVYNDCSSDTSIVELNAGDEVYVQHHASSGDYVNAHQNILNSFTGVLLQIL
ncbi:heavy metal-binding protein HIP-like isoform X2 [Dreissena polymorpha]|uniref:heavy metal-binding protein HIP-like isoform X2 n=1 Tax=Dreissena polymorpha TaxID=45954 RepID=UPI00226430C4|nr:heavy metal-binding protein HIP-like isoform X2 [Dreissena polymorpha]